MKTRRFDLVGLGECMIELRSADPLGSATVFDCGYGGDVLNALVTAARMGGRTGFITRTGADPFGAALVNKWREEGINVDCANLVEGENGVYFISLLPGGEREFTYRRQGSAASCMQAADLDAAYIASASCLLISGITQAISASAQATVLAACEIAHRHGVMVAYDPNYRERLWSTRGGLKAARDAWRELIPYVDIMLPSYPSDAVLIDQIDLRASDVAREFGNFCMEVAQKCGEDGSGVLLNGTYQSFVPSIAACVIDTTGAGDAWNGAYLLQRLRGMNVSVAAGIANRVAAATLAYRGAIPPRSYKEQHSK